MPLDKRPYQLDDVQITDETILVGDNGSGEQSAGRFKLGAIRNPLRTFLTPSGAVDKVPDGQDYLVATDGADDLLELWTMVGSTPTFKRKLNTTESKLTKLNANRTRFNSRRKPTFAFIWDDLNQSDALVYSVFREYNFLPSFALTGSSIDSENIKDYQDFYLNGCSILAHSMSHPNMGSATTLTEAQADYQMTESKKLIESYGIQVSGWVTPSSELNSSFDNLIIKNFGYGFTRIGGPFNSTTDPVFMSRYGIEAAMLDQPNTQVLKDRIDTAIVNKELVVFYGHKLPSTYLNTDSSSSFTEDDLRDVLSYLRTLVDDNQCEVLACDQAIEKYYKTPIV